MNAKNKLTIEKIVTRAKAYSGKVQSILDNYTEEKSKIMETAKNYKEQYGQAYGKKGNRHGTETRDDAKRTNQVSSGHDR